jgi:YfiH family protein
MVSPLTHLHLAHTSIQHGFFTREGGVSDGIYASLNLGIGSDDTPEHVMENRARVTGWFGAAPDQLMTCRQIHSPTVTVVEQATPLASRPEADAMVTKNAGIILGILTADCAPVLFFDSDAGVIGAAHAGWKGAIGGVLENTVSAMESLGAVRENIRAVIGPTIAPDSYEVGEEFAQRFLEQNAEYQAFFRAGKVGHYWFDLPVFVVHRLTSIGVNAVWCGVDTLAKEDLFYSYRRTCLRGEKDYGRQISAIMLTPSP